MAEDILTIVTWKWKPKKGYRSAFGPETVNTLRRMVARNYMRPHRFICVTDDAAGIDTDIETIQLWNDFADVPSPAGEVHPSCYRRLRMFHPDAEQWFGKRFVSLDLDAVITGDMEPMWRRCGDFTIWGDTNPTTPYNGSMIMMDAGARPKVWTDFDPIKSPELTKAMGYFGSDQAWIGACLGPDERKWTRRDGIYSFRNELGPLRQELPLNCRVVMFHGHVDPWSPVAQDLPWVKEHYR